MFKAARRMGIGSDEFWNLTPREFWNAVEAAEEDAEAARLASQG